MLKTSIIRSWINRALNRTPLFSVYYKHRESIACTLERSLDFILHNITFVSHLDPPNTCLSKTYRHGKPRKSFFLLLVKELLFNSKTAFIPHLNSPFISMKGRSYVSSSLYTQHPLILWRSACPPLFLTLTSNPHYLTLSSSIVSCLLFWPLVLEFIHL